MGIVALTLISRAFHNSMRGGGDNLLVALTLISRAFHNLSSTPGSQMIVALTLISRAFHNYASPKPWISLGFNPITIHSFRLTAAYYSIVLHKA